MRDASNWTPSISRFSVTMRCFFFSLSLYSDVMQCISFLQLCLTVDHPQKVLMLGEAMDFGTCKAKKKNGDSCTQLVNLVSTSSRNPCFHFSWICIHFFPTVNSMNASTASTTLKRNTRKWAQRGPSFSPVTQALPLVKEKAVEVYENACAKVISTMGVCHHLHVRHQCKLTLSFKD